MNEIHSYQVAGFRTTDQHSSIVNFKIFQSYKCSIYNLFCCINKLNTKSIYGSLSPFSVIVPFPILFLNVSHQSAGNMLAISIVIRFLKREGKNLSHYQESRENDLLENFYIPKYNIYSYSHPTSHLWANASGFQKWQTPCLGPKITKQNKFQRKSLLQSTKRENVAEKFIAGWI